MTTCNEKHMCFCGTGPGGSGGHPTNEDGCVRYMVEAPVRSETMYLGEALWKVGDHEITDYTLRHQRGYSNLPCGCWSRWPGSKNSIKG